MASSSEKARPELPTKLHDNLGGYIEPLGRHLLAYLGYEEVVPDEELLRIAGGMEALRLERGLCRQYNAFILRVANRWSYRRIAEHYAISTGAAHGLVAGARVWVRRYLEAGSAVA